MKTETRIRNRLDEIESTPQFKQRPAEIFSNAPLALIQTGLEAQSEVLRWVLNLKPETSDTPTPTRKAKP